MQALFSACFRSFSGDVTSFFRAGCRRVYTPYLQKGTQYFGSRCAATCSNTKKSFNIEFLEEGVGKFFGRLIFTDDEKIQLDSATSTDISLFEEKRLDKIEQSDRRKKKIREDLTP